MKIHYHTVGVLVFLVGVALIIDVPGSLSAMNPHLSSPDQLTIVHGQTPMIRLFAGFLQAVGILLFLKWLKEEKKEYFSVYRKYLPVLLALLVFAVPMLLNHLLATTARTVLYSGSKEIGAIEYVTSKSACNLSDEKDSVVECKITLKNYDHQSKRLSVNLVFDQLTDSKETVVYLLQRQEKQIRIELPITKKDEDKWMRKETPIIPKVSYTTI